MSYGYYLEKLMSRVWGERGEGAAMTREINRSLLGSYVMLASNRIPVICKMGERLTFSVGNSLQLRVRLELNRYFMESHPTLH